VTAATFVEIWQKAAVWVIANTAKLMSSNAEGRTLLVLCLAEKMSVCGEFVFKKYLQKKKAPGSDSLGAFT
jgi:hypothetical protein